MRAFIIRPFGTKNNIDFDAVERKLIDPALKNLKITGRTTAEIFRAGNIRVDMFQRLLTADLIVTDISIHNANVYYELGIRHALRDKITILIRAKEEKPGKEKSDKKSSKEESSNESLSAKIDEVPFDLKTDRYLSYDRLNPETCVPELMKTIKESINSEIKDSPVFNLLPGLEAQERARFIVVPVDFQEEVERAAGAKQLGDLELLQLETRGFEWETEGLRIIGREQFRLKDFAGARETWERLLEEDSKDAEALELLATIFQKQDDLVRSEQAIKQNLNLKKLSSEGRAEFYALLGRNQKVQWCAEWRKLPPEKRGERALNSAFLEKSIESYLAGFHENLNHCYSGLNALALLIVQSRLAVQYPLIWEHAFDSEPEARRELDKRQLKISKLAAAVSFSLEAKKEFIRKSGQPDVWAKISECDLLFLTSENPPKVAAAYERILTGVADFYAASAIDQICIYRDLGIFSENATEVLAKLDCGDPEKEAVTVDDSAQKSGVLLFTGHMIDAPGRRTPRFPSAQEKAARREIRKFIKQELREAGGIKYGIAGGASGGDILFHEVCEELGIKTKLYLALPRIEFIAESVAPAGPEWIERFNNLFDRLEKQNRVRVLSDTKKLPNWLRDKPDYNVWQRTNLWMLCNAKADAGNDTTLLALWDGQTGDGPGGVVDLVERAKEFAVKSLIIDTKKILKS